MTSLLISDVVMDPAEATNKAAGEEFVFVCKMKEGDTFDTFALSILKDDDLV